jgi:hypothetical protein
MNISRRLRQIEEAVGELPCEHCRDVPDVLILQPGEPCPPMQCQRCGRQLYRVVVKDDGIDTSPRA